MDFRYNINALRAVAVVAVVVFHFYPKYLPGGFAGVDVFFVISGYLMTAIIFKGLENNNFSLFAFYSSRANRIIPALAFLCFTTFILGWFYLLPQEYKSLNKHIASSLSFTSNIIYWMESGYFDKSSHEKWLLHTWSLSVEWQFYILYPLGLLALNKIANKKTIRKTILYCTAIGFICSAYISNAFPDAAYYSLATRAWQMLAGALAFLYPLPSQLKSIPLREHAGFGLIIISLFAFSEATTWPGYGALVPVIGAYLVITDRESNNEIFKSRLIQSLGTWSYSIYLWHWPLVVLGLYLEIENWQLYGLPASVLLGYLSYKYIESISLQKYTTIAQLTYSKPVIIASILLIASSVTWFNQGISSRIPHNTEKMLSGIESSPLREKCHINAYRKPEDACEYFSRNIQWAVLGDSHGVELAYVLAKELEKRNIGLKHFTFSSCISSYGQEDNYSTCSNWYNDVAKYIQEDAKLENIVIIHRYSLAGEGSRSGPRTKNKEQLEASLSSIDSLVRALADKKKNVYIFMPIPELDSSIERLLGNAYMRNKLESTMMGKNRSEYESENIPTLNFLKSQEYPSNVFLVDTSEVFCGKFHCFATLDGKALYFDDDHPSLLGAQLLVNQLMNFTETPKH
jgi:peptidoglycan/LPS O-acetylase OafA/YrhL